METINIRIIRDDLPPKTFESIQSRNQRLSTLTGSLWINYDFDLAIWRPAQTNPRLNGNWALATIVLPGEEEGE